MALCSEAGGLFYHVKALTWGPWLWGDYRARLAQWLSIWLSTLPRGVDRLVVFGPSAGHCLPASLWEHFSVIDAFEPDPIARFWLRRRISRASGGKTLLRVDATDHLLLPLLERHTSPFELARDGRTSVLFSNLLGQVKFMLTPTQYACWVAALQQIFLEVKGVPWASFHDRLSTVRTPYIDALRTSRVYTNLELARAFFVENKESVIEEGLPPHSDSTFLHSHLKCGKERQWVLVDHETTSLFPEHLPREYLHFPITPHQHHITEAVVG